MAIIRKGLKVKAHSVINDKPLKDIALERMGIKPGICPCCGENMVLIQLAPNNYRKKQRAPPFGQLTPNIKFND